MKTRLILFHFFKTLSRPPCIEPARQKSQCLPFLWAHLFQFPTPILNSDYISQIQYINRQITMPLPESNLSAELCLKNKKPLQTVCAYRCIEPDAVFPVNGWDCETVLYCWTFSFLVMIMGIGALFHHTSMKMSRLTTTKKAFRKAWIHLVSKTDEKQCFFAQPMINLGNSVLHNINEDKCSAVSKVRFLFFLWTLRSLFCVHAAADTTPKLWSQGPTTTQMGK